MNTIETPRLKLRQWQQSDYATFAAMNADPVVMEFFPRLLTRSQSDALVEKVRGLIADRGWGFWAVEVKDSGDFAGFVGLNEPGYAIPCSPCVEVGWRLDQAFWGKGYATEAGTAALDFAFNTLQLTAVVSFTATLNLRSQAVMQRLGMTNTGENFEHPLVPEGDRLREHVLYKIARSDWLRDKHQTQLALASQPIANHCANSISEPNANNRSPNLSN
jgi:RimJ/RimL family protein N-acetyltransferase